jgi:hypothetical protein
MESDDHLLTADFPRRPHQNGPSDSICPYCFATVFPLTKGSNLKAAEVAHDCWQREDADRRTD